MSERANPPCRSRRRALKAGLAAGMLALPVRAAPPPSRPFRIFMVLHRSGAKADEGFRDHLKSAGLDVEYTVRNIENDRTLLPGIVAEIKAARPDLVYTQSSEVTAAVAGRLRELDPAKHVTDIPVVFSMVADPVGAGLLQSLDRPGRKLTGAIHVIALDVQLKAMRAYLPVQRLGIIYTPNVASQRNTFERLRGITSAAHIELVAADPLDGSGTPSRERIPAMLDAIAAAKPDLVFVPPNDFFSPLSEMLMEGALGRGLATFCSIEVQVNAGGLMGLVSRLVNVGALAGYKAEQILLGQARIEAIPAEVLSRFSFIVNMKSARRLQKYPPMQVLRYAQAINA